jgi:hypothetical protein
MQGQRAHLRRMGMPWNAAWIAGTPALFSRFALFMSSHCPRSYNARLDFFDLYEKNSVSERHDGSMVRESDECRNAAPISSLKQRDRWNLVLSTVTLCQSVHSIHIDAFTNMKGIIFARSGSYQ